MNEKDIIKIHDDNMARLTKEIEASTKRANELIVILERMIKDDPEMFSRIRGCREN